MTYRKLLNDVFTQLNWMRNDDAGYVATELRGMANSLCKQIQSKLDSAKIDNNASSKDMPDEIWAGTKAGDLWHDDQEFDSDVLYVKKEKMSTTPKQSDELYNLDIAMARAILPLLKEFAAGCEINAKVLTEIIEGMEIIAYDNFTCDKVKQNKANKSAKLLGERFCGLWC